MDLNPLTALSPIDGRYAKQTDVLRNIFSEYAFMNARVRVETEWLIALSEQGFAELPEISAHGKAFLRDLADNFSIVDCEAIKEIEKTQTMTSKQWNTGLSAKWITMMNCAKALNSCISLAPLKTLTTPVTL